MDKVGAKTTPVETGYEMDEELKAILKDRYKDMSDKFTPEAQRERRNNRLRFTFYVALFCMAMVNFILWACSKGLMGTVPAFFGICICMIAVGYNIGVCVCHNKGWRGA